jgi:hypothetical protein
MRWYTSLSFIISIVWFSFDATEIRRIKQALVLVLWKMVYGLYTSLPYTTVKKQIMVILWHVVGSDLLSLDKEYLLTLCFNLAKSILIARSARISANIEHWQPNPAKFSQISHTVQGFCWWKPRVWILCKFYTFIGPDHEPVTVAKNATIDQALMLWTYWKV